jgi:hypothetical protein
MLTIAITLSNAIIVPAPYSSSDLRPRHPKHPELPNYTRIKARVVPPNLNGTLSRTSETSIRESEIESSSISNSESLSESEIESQSQRENHYQSGSDIGINGGRNGGQGNRNTNRTYGTGSSQGSSPVEYWWRVECDQTNWGVACQLRCGCDRSGILHRPNVIGQICDVRCRCVHDIRFTY